MEASYLQIGGQVKAALAPQIWRGSGVLLSPGILMQLEGWKGAYLAALRRIVWRQSFWRRGWKARRSNCAKFLSRRFRHSEAELAHLCYQQSQMEISSLIATLKGTHLKLLRGRCEEPVNKMHRNGGVESLIFWFSNLYLELIMFCRKVSVHEWCQPLRNNDILMDQPGYLLSWGIPFACLGYRILIASDLGSKLCYLYCIIKSDTIKEWNAC